MILDTILKYQNVFNGINTERKSFKRVCIKENEIKYTRTTTCQQGLRNLNADSAQLLLSRKKKKSNRNPWTLTVYKDHLADATSVKFSCHYRHRRAFTEGSWG